MRSLSGKSTETDENYKKHFGINPFLKYKKPILPETVDRRRDIMY